MYHTKRFVIEEWLNFVNEHKSLSKVKLGTLGGKGIEPANWQRFKIPVEHGFLVESHPSRRRKLKERFEYKAVSKISQLITKLDAFHLDLSGTLPSSGNSLFQALKVISKRGGARCLAITEAGSRGSLSEIYFDDMYRKLVGRIGTDKVHQLYVQLLTENEWVMNLNSENGQSFPKNFRANVNPHSGARRILYSFGYMLEAFIKVRWYPIDIKRFIYTSRYSGYSRRMLMYMFLLGRGVHQNFYFSWMRSPLCVALKSGVYNFNQVEMFLPECESQAQKVADLKIRLSEAVAATAEAKQSLQTLVGPEFDLSFLFKK